MYYIKISIILAVCTLTFSLSAQEKTGRYSKVDTEAFGDNTRHWYGIFDKGNIINPRPGRPHYKATEITHIADNILLYQKDNGGWPKNYDMMAILSPDQKDSLLNGRHIHNTTFDNGTTYTQIACLSNVYHVTHATKYKDAAIKGFEFILSAQYPNGGWPQYYPLEPNYSRHITYNDGAMVGILMLLKDVDEHRPEYSFIDQKLRGRLHTAYNKGIDCILKTQIRDKGKLTAWCQQHDEVTLQPAWARAFEPPAICNGESAGIVLFLMSLDHPRKEIREAIESAIAWFKESEIHNTAVKTIPAPLLITKFRKSVSDRIVVTDSTAKPIWTRYYEPGTHKPLFCNRDSKVVYSLAEVDRERRDGYAWYTYAPRQALDQFADWQQKKGHHML